MLIYRNFEKKTASRIDIKMRQDISHSDMSKHPQESRATLHKKAFKFQNSDLRFQL